VGDGIAVVVVSMRCDGHNSWRRFRARQQCL
jgi:hypothetical protein